jgi:hypothetical protein
MGTDENDPYRWLKTKEIAVTEKYTIENARASTKTLFPFTLTSGTITRMYAQAEPFRQLLAII